MPRTSLLAIVVLFLHPGIPALGATLTSIAPAPGYTRLEPHAISDDGRVVIGTQVNSVSGLYSAFRWTAATGVEPLSTIGNYTYIDRLAASADGATLVGAGFLDWEFEHFESVYWTGSSVGVRFGEVDTTYATAITGDGSQIFGAGFRWTEADGFEDLPVYVVATSADGEVVIGLCDSNPNDACRYVRGGDATHIMELSASYVRPPLAISADGRTIAGVSNTRDLYRWTELEGLVNLWDAARVQLTSVNDITNDGRQIVGHINTASGRVAAIWDAENEEWNLRDFLIEEYGLTELASSRLDDAVAITPDGNSILVSGGQGAYLVSGLACQVAGDTDSDCDVDLNDLNSVRNNFGLEGAVGATAGDAYPFDGVVNVEDLNAVRNNFGVSNPSAVPEPASLCVAALGIIFLGATRIPTKKMAMR